MYEHTRSRGTARAERLPYIKIGKYKRFDPGAVRDFLPVEDHVNRSGDVTTMEI